MDAITDLRLGELWVTGEEHECDDSPHFTYDIAPPAVGSSCTPMKVEGWLVPDDATMVKETLFHSRIWNGGTRIADHLSSMGRALTEGKTVVEFGAGGGLPALVSLALGARCCVLTDYPNSHILENIRRNVEHNFPGELLSTDGASLSKRACVVGHQWGHDMKDVMQCLSRLEGNADGLEGVGAERPLRGATDGFDIALLGEVVWLHDAHSALLSSVRAALKPGGVAFVGFCNFVRGCEDDDFHFFKEAEATFGFAVEQLETKVGKHQFTDAKVAIHLYKMTRCSNSASPTSPPEGEEIVSRGALSANERANQDRTLTVSKVLPYFRQRRFSETVDMITSAYGHTLPLGKYRTSNRKRLINLELAVQQAFLAEYTPGWCTEIIRLAQEVCTSGAYDSGFMSLVLRAVGGWARMGPQALTQLEARSIHKEIFCLCANPAAIEKFMDAFGISLVDASEDEWRRIAEYVEYWSVQAPEGVLEPDGCDALANIILKGGDRLVKILSRDGE